MVITSTLAVVVSRCVSGCVSPPCHGMLSHGFSVIAQTTQAASVWTRELPRGTSEQISAVIIRPLLSFSTVSEKPLGFR